MNNNKIILAGDVGGTKTLLALYECSGKNLVELEITGDLYLADIGIPIKVYEKLNLKYTYHFWVSILLKYFNKIYVGVK